jgi:vancomycin resistance protein YoaR
VAWIVDEQRHEDSVARNVTLAGELVGGLDKEALEKRLSDQGSDESVPVTIITDSGTVETTADELGVGYDAEATINATLDASRPGNPFSFIARLFTTYSVDPVLEIDQTTFETAVSELDLELESPTDPIIEIADGSVAVSAGSSGQKLDIDGLTEQIYANYDRSGFEVEVEVVETDAPNPDDDLIEAAQAMAEAIEDGVDVTIESDTVSVPAIELADWLIIETVGGEPELAIDEEVATAYLTTKFSDPLVKGTDATFTVEGTEPKIVGGRPDTVCCDPQLGTKVLRALYSGDATVKLDGDSRQRPFGRQWAKNLGISELIGEFETFYTPGQSRVDNIARIAELTRGVVIEPGGTFSVNDFVGRRTAEDGFVAAGVIYQGVFSDDVGGGISQYATTLFNAAFFAGLDFGEYQSHSIYISRYPYGREATLSFPNPDLQIKNTTPHAVLLWPTTDEDSITVRLFSTKFVEGTQTGQSSAASGVACTKVSTERTRVYEDDREPVVDTVTALYRAEGVACDGTSSVPTTTPPPTVAPTTPPPTAPPATPAPTAPPATPAPTAPPPQVTQPTEPPVTQPKQPPVTQANKPKQPAPPPTTTKKSSGDSQGG